MNLKPCPKCGGNPNYAAFTPNAIGILDGLKPSFELYCCMMSAKAETAEAAIGLWEAGDTQLKGE